jgi:hypothetical protein
MRCGRAPLGGPLTVVGCAPSAPTDIFPTSYGVYRPWPEPARQL